MYCAAVKIKYINNWKIDARMTRTMAVVLLL